MITSHYMFVMNLYMQCCWYPTALCPPRRTGQYHVLTQGTWSQLSRAGRSLKLGTTPCSWGRYAARSGAAMWKIHRQHWGVYGSRPCSGSSLTDMGNQYGGMDHYASIHSERYGNGVSVMARCPIPTLWNRSPIPPSPLWWMKRIILSLSRVGLQEGWPHLDSS